mgnify:CR=1 FL=1
MNPEFVYPQWAAPARVHAFFSTRKSGFSTGPYAGLNLGDHVGDDPLAVTKNRALISATLPGEPRWLKQVHGTRVALSASPSGAVADAAISRVAGEVCVVMVADCLPVLFTDCEGSVVAAAHAGWRGLAAGVLERTLDEMGCAPGKTLAWMGPAIGPESFEVGPEVRAAFVGQSARAAEAFRPGREDRFLADIFLLARQRLEGMGLRPDAISGGGISTVTDPDRFYSYRRDGASGRMGAFIWIDAPS